jgi:hypothetical protein
VVQDGGDGDGQFGAVALRARGVAGDEQVNFLYYFEIGG